MRAAIQRTSCPTFTAVARMPLPIGLVSTSRSPGTRTGIGEQKIGMRAARDGQTVLELGVDHGVTADNERSRLVNLLLAAGAGSRSSTSSGRSPGRKRDNVERGERLPPIA